MDVYGLSLKLHLSHSEVQLCVQINQIELYVQINYRQYI